MERHKLWDKRRKAQAAMASLAFGVIGFDALCENGWTISRETDELRETKMGRILVPLIVGTVALHLLRVQRRLGVEWADPINLISNLFQEEEAADCVISQ